MKLSQAGIDLIKSFEGCSLKAYKVPGANEKYWTIGYGSYGPHVKEGQVITKAQAEEMLKDELAKFEKGVTELLKVSVNQNQFNALTSFAYNCGLGNLKVSTLLKLVNKKEFAAAANEFGKWTKAGGNELKGLVRRRKAEKDMFLKKSAPVAPKKETPKKEVPKKETPKATKVEYYIVKPGDMLTNIAKKFKTTTAAIDKLNKGITNVNKIYAGQKIRVK